MRSLQVAVGLAVACAGIGAAASARAHGTMLVPESRIHRCAFDGAIENHADPACRAAIDRGGTQAIYDWNGVRQGAADGRHREIVPDGALCSGGNPDFAGLDLARADWRTTPIAPDARGRFEFVWHATAPHATRDWALYLTRDGWNPTEPLGWDEVELFCAAGALPLEADAEGRQVYRIPCDLPPRNGRHVVFATWQRSDSPEAFYSCSDVDFTGGTDDGWKQIGRVRAAEKLPVGTTVTFRLFDELGRDLERISLALARGQVTRAKWPFHLARKVNATSAYARIGVLSASGEVAPSERANGNFVYTLEGRALSFEIDVAKPGGGGGGGGGGGTDPVVYPAGVGGYGPGTVVRGADGFLYECRSFPYSGWCNQAPAYYAPGTGLAWADAWVRR